MILPGLKRFRATAGPSTLLTWVPGLTVGTKVVAGNSLDEFLQHLLIARLLALAHEPGHGRGSLVTFNIWRIDAKLQCRDVGGVARVVGGNTANIALVVRWTEFGRKRSPRVSGEKRGAGRQIVYYNIYI
jgi:hypothetical protein